MTGYARINCGARSAPTVRLDGMSTLLSAASRCPLETYAIECMHTIAAVSRRVWQMVSDVHLRLVMDLSDLREQVCTANRELAC